MSENLDEILVINQVKKWVWDVVVGLNFCPFAKAPYEKDMIRYRYIPMASSVKVHKNNLKEELEFLDDHNAFETTIMVMPKFKDFYQYLDFLDSANQYISALGFEGVYQLASFHPQYLFENSEEDDPANYTNRSPYPLLHIIRESSIDRALKGYRKAELIPERNMEVARELGLIKMQAMLDACMQLEKK